MMFTPFYIALTLGALIIAALATILLIAAFKPNHFRVERSICINAPAERIFPILNDLKQQRYWSPWDQKDPGMKRAYSGPDTGVGARYEWDGNKQIGAGSQQITASKPNERIDIDIDFTRPFEAHNKIEFLLRPSVAGTDVTWAIQGPMPFMFRAMSVLFSMNKMMNAEFDKGLAQLKALVEK